MKLGFADLMGRLGARAHPTGLDTVSRSWTCCIVGLGQPGRAVPPAISRDAQVGRLGRKSGRGFYDYR